MSKPAILNRITQSRWSVASVILILVAIIYIGFLTYRVSTYIEIAKIALSPPNLPEYDWDIEEAEYLNPVGGGDNTNEWFHFANQGTATLPIPYEWFLALEEPRSSKKLPILGEALPLLLKIMWGESEPFTDKYIYQHGFIKSASSKYNPDSLPIGFTKTPSIYFDGINRRSDALGLTCAACHTGQLTHNNKRYIVDGGPAVTDLGLFGQSLGAALGQTVLSSKLIWHSGRFERFAKRVLGDNDNLISRARLKKELTATITNLKGATDIINVTEGFTRNDALNRIGNRVFSQDFDHPGNYSAINAPVTYPHLWTTSWFDWVQYDGSIMQPLIRNSGEALGVKAYLDTVAPGEQRFASSVDMENLSKIEYWLSGDHPKGEATDKNNKFNGLKAPKWPDTLPPINKGLASEGKKLYENNCQKCHLPAVNSPEFWSDNYWKNISYYTSDDEYKETDNKYLQLNIIPLNAIGTDPSQAAVLQKRTVNTTGLNMDTEVCTNVNLDKNGQTKKVLKYVKLSDSATGNFGLSLGAVVDRTNEHWFKQNFIPQTMQPDMEGNRPNCLQVGQGYKARPLNGVWSTAPFLHNGSVASIYDLLTPAANRPKFVELGSTSFDTKKLGIVQSSDVADLNKAYENKKHIPTPKAKGDYSDEGYFLLDTRQMGNLNTGHSFEGNHTGRARNGVIGRAFSEEEKAALIEYLKSI